MRKLAERGLPRSETAKKGGCGWLESWERASLDQPEEPARLLTTQLSVCGRTGKRRRRPLTIPHADGKARQPTG
jgi:hypothetical protein